MFGFLLIAVVIAFFIWLVVFRNNVIEYQEKIKEAKSRVRVEKSTMGRTSRAVQEERSAPFSVKSGVFGANVNTVGFLQGDMGKASIYGKKTDTLTSLSQSVERSQYDLNKLILDYNRYIRKFPNMIVAALLRCKKEEYIDEGNLKKGLELD